MSGRVVLTPAFGHFETVRPLWTRLAHWLICLAIATALVALAGRSWTFICLLGPPLIGATLHVIWCRRHGIKPLTAEPRDRYEQLRSDCQRLLAGQRSLLR